ncbi:hypothetical protein C481_03467 [Natrialba asiatica DSM 12278]|uniref:Uncharacterized protein n=1 Tax=Natrialba asiatica (strain ATCC 700177 / DSM 12278 / JCM 9576 / FERM P-10747 / NBRC 102637 / 172P1) TaxID=29540 RepID=M0B246_NATA1|nr:hypothetical protein C481_03467 [Natrialba asiatica DSM 12278]
MDHLLEIIVASAKRSQTTRFRRRSSTTTREKRLARATIRPFHPKVGASYQVSRWDKKLGVTPEELNQLGRELDQTILSDSRMLDST